MLLKYFHLWRKPRDHASLWLLQQFWLARGEKAHQVLWIQFMFIWKRNEVKKLENKGGDIQGDS